MKVFKQYLIVYKSYEYIISTYANDKKSSSNHPTFNHLTIHFVIWNPLQETILTQYTGAQTTRDLTKAYSESYTYSYTVLFLDLLHDDDEPEDDVEAAAVALLAMEPLLTL